MVPVTAGQVGDFATAYASMRWDSANTPKPVRLDVAFYNSSNVLVGTVQNGPTFTPDEFAYIRTQNNGNVIPANTAWVSIRATIPSSVTGDAIRVDAVTVTITDTDPSSTPANWPEYAPKDTTVLNPDPWVPGVTPGTFQNTPTVFAEVECGDDLWEPIYDPLCPALTVPPTPPSIPLGCFDPPASWDRRKVTLPAEHVPLWSEMAPVVTLSTTDAQRNIRLRFYRDPTESLDPNATPCAWDEDLVISYIPAQGVMIIDAAAEEVWVETVTGQRRRADSLIYTTEGKPFEWPVLACGDQHIITLDTPVGVTPPVIDLTLIPRTI